MKNTIKLFSIIIFSATFPWHCFAIDSWPGGAGTTIATLSEPSGIVWHEGRQSIFVVEDSGTLKEINSTGTTLNTWPLAGNPDLEGITLAENDRYLYIGVENPDSIAEWDLTSWMASADPNQGLEGLTYRDGYFYAGLQENGKIYVFDLNLSVGGDVDYVETITPYASYSDISGIDYNSDTGITYAIFDSANALLELNAADGIVEHYSLPDSAQQEGIAIKTNCLSRTADVYIANDDSGQVVKYASYPITCLDADSDGVSYATDCNDYDAAVSSNQTYYRDVDSDGLGDAYTTSQVCSLAAPEGYVANSSDPADIFSSGSKMYANGNYHDFFTIDPTTVEYTDLNFFGDDWREIIAVGLVSKRAYITFARVRGSEVAVTKRVRVKIKRKHKTVQIVPNSAKNKFTTRFSRGKKYTWKAKSSGSFKRSK